MASRGTDMRQRLRRDVAAYEDSLQSAVRLLRSRSSRFAWIGTGIAVAAVILGSLLVAQHFYLGISYETVLRAQRENAALWVLDALPFIYAIWGQIASLRVSKDAGSAIRLRTKSLRHQLRRTRHDSRARTEYFARLSHEFRTPLNSILGVSDMLLDSPEAGPEEFRKGLRVVQGATENLLALVNDILDFSAIEVGRVELDRVEFDLHECVANACEMLREQARRKGLVLQLAIRPDVPRHVVGDPGRLRQVLVNLASNAIKYTQRGTVDVRLSYRGGTIDRMHELVLSVNDTGVGMTEKQLKRLFEPYHKGSGRDLPNTGGESTGLGMAITQELVDAMHGSIEVESWPDHGTKVDVSLKLDRSHGVNMDAVARHIGLRGVRVLLVDSPDAERNALLAQLQALEMDAVAVDDGVEGMKAALHAAATGRPFDIVLVAMQLDHLDGEELGRRLLDRPATRNCCLAMMTQVGTRGDAKRLKEAGFSAYFLKPIPPEHLGELLRATLATMSLDDEQRRVQGLVTRYYVSDRKPHRFQVLVVEDDPVSREASCRRLEQLGCEVRSVGSGEECFVAVESSNPDLVLLDQNLPDLRGDEIAERLPRVISGEMPPIVIFSAGLTQAEKQRCRQAGVAGFLTKPATTVGLRETLQRFGWKESEAPVDASADPGLLTAYLRE
ncbi:MAG: response regulator, partial [Xanthomonadales bacterium]|nr:response regulator [Xanthomonadales bacterium]